MKHKWAFLTGLLYGAFLILIPRCLIRYSEVLFDFLSHFINPSETRYSQISMALHQFQSAEIRSPWIVFLLIGLLFSISFTIVYQYHPRRLVISMHVLIGILLFLPLMITALWFTTVNGIQIGALLRVLLPMLLGGS